MSSGAGTMGHLKPRVLRESVSGAVIYVPSLIKIDSGIKMLIWGGGYTGTRTDSNMIS
jgi:hypothetical protein